MSLISVPSLTPPTASSIHFLHLARNPTRPIVKASSSSSSSAAAAPPAYALTVQQSLICGAVARATQIFSVFPIDTVKTRLQSEQATRLALSSAASAASATTTATAASSWVGNISRAVGQGKLYAGVGASLAGQVPYGMFTFGIYETVRARLPGGLPDWLRTALAAGIGDAVGSLWLTPSEVIKSKTQTGVYSSPMHAVRAIARSSNGPLAFYQGYAAALARDVPFRAIQMVLYERCRSLYIQRFDVTNRQMTPLENVLVGAISGSITAFVTNPVDVIRTRVMSQPVGDQALYANALDCVVKTLSKEGITALFKGVGPRTFMVGPASAIFFVTYESIKTFYRNRSNQSLLVAVQGQAQRNQHHHPHHHYPQRNFFHRCRCPRRRSVT